LKASKVNGSQLKTLIQKQKLLDIISAIIAKRLGCQLIQRKASSKDAKVARDTFMPLISGKINTKMIAEKRRH
jgi:hypothetical protein